MKLFIPFLFSLIIFSDLFACDCPPMEKLSVEGLQTYQVIFSGRVDSVSLKGEKGIVWFLIDTLFKGESARTIPVYFDKSSNCRMEFEKGFEWIIYASYKNFGKAEVEFCSRSRKHFTDEAGDYYTVNNGMSYASELVFLKNNLGLKAFKKPEPSIDKNLQRELIHPSPFQMLYWLGFSLAGFLGIYYLMKKFLK